MAVSTQSKIQEIEEQIRKLKEKQKKEIAKLERNTGKKLIEKFKLEDKSLDEIYQIIDSLKLPIEEVPTNESMTDTNNE